MKGGAAHLDHLSSRSNEFVPAVHASERESNPTGVFYADNLVSAADVMIVGQANAHALRSRGFCPSRHDVELVNICFAK